MVTKRGCFYENHTLGLFDDSVRAGQSFPLCVHVFVELVSLVPKINQAFSVAQLLDFDYFRSYSFVGGFSASHN